MTRATLGDRAADLLRARPRVAVVVVVLLVAAVVTAVVVVRSIDHSPRATMGEVWLDRAIETPTAPDASVRVPLPDGFALLTVGAPRERLVDGYDELELDEVPDSVEEPETVVRAPDGGTLVPLALAADPNGTDQAGVQVGLFPAPEAALDAVPEPTVVVETAGEEVDLGTQLSDLLTLQEDSTPVVALPGDGSSYTVHIGFDGEEQQVDVEDGEVVAHRQGRFAAYEGEDLLGEATDVPPRPGGGFEVGGYDPGAGGIDVQRAVRVPWVAGLGWAPAGRAWVALSLGLRDPFELDRGRRAYPGTLSPDLPSASYRLGSTRPRTVVGEGATALEPVPTLVVFPAPEAGTLDDVEVVVDQPLDRDGFARGVSGPASVPVHWTVPVPVDG